MRPSTNYVVRADDGYVVSAGVDLGFLKQMMAKIDCWMKNEKDFQNKKICRIMKRGEDYNRTKKYAE